MSDKKRIRVRKPRNDPTNALPGLILEARKDKKGWSLRDLEAATRELSPDDDGVTINVLSFWERGVVRNPTLPSLALVGQALEIPLWKMITALGFDLGLGQQPANDERTARVQRLLAAASDDDLTRISRLLGLNETERVTIDVTLDALESRRG